MLWFHSLLVFINNGYIQSALIKIICNCHSFPAHDLGLLHNNTSVIQEVNQNEKHLEDAQDNALSPSSLLQVPTNSMEPPKVSLYSTAVVDFKANYDHELSFQRGDMIVITNQQDAAGNSNTGWWQGHVKGRGDSKGNIGFFPANYVKVVQDGRLSDVDDDIVSSSSSSGVVSSTSSRGGSSHGGQSRGGSGKSGRNMAEGAGVGFDGVGFDGVDSGRDGRERLADTFTPSLNMVHAEDMVNTDSCMISYERSPFLRGDSNSSTISNSSNLINENASVIPLVLTPVDSTVGMPRTSILSNETSSTLTPSSLTSALSQLDLCTAMSEEETPNTDEDGVSLKRNLNELTSDDETGLTKCPRHVKAKFDYVPKHKDELAFR